MKEYSFQLPRPKLNTYHWFGFLLVLLNAIYIFYSINLPAKNQADPFFSRAALIICFVSAAIFLVFRKKSLGAYAGQFLLLALVFITAAYFFKGLSWLALLVGLLALLYHLSQRRSWLRIKNAHIIYPGLFNRTLNWSSLNNVILKDGMLTIDMADDHLLQLEITESVDEKEFNEFCRGRLINKINE